MSEREIIKQAKKRYKLGTQMLEKIIEKNFGIHIPHNGSPFGVHMRGENGRI